MVLKRHPYIIATIIATLLAVVVWFCVPKEYTAITKLSDENKEVDLIVGYNKTLSRLKNLKGLENKGINDMGVYSKILHSEDFVRTISQIKVHDRNIKYGDYLAVTDTIETITNRIGYNYNNNLDILTIGFTDNDPKVAAYMLSKVVEHLQNTINRNRQAIVGEMLDNAINEYKRSSKEYKKAQHEYSMFMDANLLLKTPSLKQKGAALENEMKMAYKQCEEATIQYVRQRALKQRAYFSFATLVPVEVSDTPNNYVAWYIIIAILIAVCSVKVYRLYKEHITISFGDVFSPWAITITVWAAMLILLMFRNHKLLYAPSEQFYYSLLLWLTGFCVFSVIFYNSSISKYKNVEQNDASRIELSTLNIKFFNILFILSIIITPLYVMKIYEVVLMLGTEDFMYNVRIYAVNGNTNLGLLDYSVTINISLLIVSLKGYPRIKKYQVVWACFACILNALAIMEKGGILIVFFCIMYVLYERKKIKIRSAIIITAAIIVLFFIFNLMRGEEDSEYRNEETLLGFITMYILSPPVAFCELVQDVEYQFAARTLPTIYYLLNKYVADIYIVYDRLQQFVAIPIPTNVYTVLQPFYQDFGYIGVMTGGSIYGLIYGVMYGKMRRGNDFSKCLYLYFAYVLAIQFFQENIFTMGLYVPRIMFFTYICTQKKFTFKPVEKTVNEGSIL